MCLDAPANENYESVSKNKIPASQVPHSKKHMLSIGKSPCKYFLKKQLFSNNLDSVKGPV